MEQNAILETLKQALDKLPDGPKLIQELIDRYGPEVTPEQIRYWLDESGFSLSAWRNRHLEEGEDKKAAAEEEKLDVVSKALNLLEPLFANHSSEDSPEKPLSLKKEQDLKQ